MAGPKLGEFQYSVVNVQEGDRVMVKLSRPLSVAQMDRIKGAIQSWAGSEVPVIFLDSNLMELRVVKNSG